MRARRPWSALVLLLLQAGLRLGALLLLLLLLVVVVVVAGGAGLLRKHRERHSIYRR